MGRQNSLGAKKDKNEEGKKGEKTERKKKEVKINLHLSRNRFKSFV